MSKLVIYGAGSLGIGIGYFLRNEDVYFVGRADIVKNINAGVMTFADHGEIPVKGSAVLSIEDLLAIPDMVIITTKSYDTEIAITDITRKWRDIPIISLQNGLTNTDIIKRTVMSAWKKESAELVITGVTNYGFYMNSSRTKVIYGGEGMIWLGGSDYADIACDIFVRNGLKCITVKDISKIVWLKGIVNSVINPITAIANIENGHLENPLLTDIIGGLVSEGVEVARMEGVNITMEEVYDMLYSTIAKTAGNRSSMLVDLNNKKRIEVDEINGYIMKKGKEFGLKVIYNEVIYELAKFMESLKNR